MAERQSGPGLWHVGAFQSSCVPYVSSSIVVPANTGAPYVVEFPYVTKNFVVRCDSGATIRLGYSENGVKALEQNNYITIDVGVSFEADYKVAKLFLISDSITPAVASISAGLTTIDSKALHTNWSGSVWGEGIG